MRAILTRLFCIMLALSGFGAAASAQGVLPDSGTRVRVFYNEGRDYFIGTLLARPADSVFVEGSAGDTLTIARTDLSLLQVAAGGSRARSTIIGMGLGLVAGAATGFAVGGRLGGGDAMGGAYVVGAELLGGIGLVAGGVIGWETGGRWRDVPIAARIGPRGAALSIAF